MRGMATSNSTDDRIIAGMGLQDEDRRTLLSGGAERLGWKAGFGTAMAKDAVSITAPLVGFITDRTSLPDGATVDVSGWTTPLLEPEVAVRIDRELTTGASAEEIHDAIGAYGAAIELADLIPVTDVETILAGNIFHRNVLLADEVPAISGGLDQARISVEIDGEPHATDADPRELLGDFAELLGSLLPQLELIGETLKPGDVVITGAAVPPIPLRSGHLVTVSISDASRVSVRIA